MEECRGVIYHWALVCGKEKLYVVRETLSRGCGDMLQTNPNCLCVSMESCRYDRKRLGLFFNDGKCEKFQTFINDFFSFCQQEEDGKRTFVRMEN